MADLEQALKGCENIDALLESNPKLYEELKAHFTTPIGEARKSWIFPRKSTMRFSLESLPPQTAEIMSLFDFNGNGKVTLDEIRQGAEELKKTRRKNRIVVWAMVIQFLVYAALTAASCGVLYVIIDHIVDTTVDTSTGALMAKDGHDNDVEVSVVSHGYTCSHEVTAIDSVTGEVKKCISGQQAAEMFEHVLAGTVIKYVNEGIETGDVQILTLGTNTTEWTESEINFGGLVLTPDADCAAALSAHHDDEHRLLLIDDLFENHIAAREMIMSKYVRPSNARKLLGDNNGGGYSQNN